MKTFRFLKLDLTVSCCFFRYSESRQNFLHSCDGSGCGKMLIEFQTVRGFPSEVDIFIAGTVLQYLAIKKQIVAAWALKSYTENHPAISRGPPFKHPLLNFIWLLLLAIEQKETISAFSTLVEKYKPSIQRYELHRLTVRNNNMLRRYIYSR